jgi:hypothetical protein
MLTEKLGLGLIFGLILLSGTAFAEISTDNGSSRSERQQRHQGRENGLSRTPPDSAISACSGKSEGTACEVTGPNGTKKGVCAYTPDKKYYACNPNDIKMSSPPAQR